MAKGKVDAMRGIFIVILCLSFSAELFAAKVKNRKTGDTSPVKITASWETGNGVRKLYDTPLGAAYSFHLSAPALENKFGFWGNLPKTVQVGKRKEVRGQGDDAAVCYPLQIRLFKNETEAAKKTRRFLVIEFSLRQFPVEQENGMELLLFTSPELFGISDPARANYFIAPFFDVKKEKREFDRLIYSRKDYMKSPSFFRKTAGGTLLSVSPLRYSPFDLFSCRIILDTSNEESRFCALNLNGEAIYISGSSRYDAIPGDTIRSVGLIVSERKTSSVWEVSPPRITLVEKLEDLKDLPALSRVPYPYERYPVPAADKIGKSKNPDELYSQALRLLNGNGIPLNLPDAAALLEKAERKNHIPARYLLAVCHWRGIGVEKDRKKAEKYLRQCIKYDYGKAVALQILLDSEKSPDANGNKKAELSLSEKEKEYFFHQAPEGMTAALLQNYRTSSFDKLDFTLNPKLAFLAAYRRMAQKKEALDYAVKAKYPPALFLRAREIYRGNPAEAERLLNSETALRHPLCRLEFLRFKALAGKLGAADLRELPLEVWDVPQFYLLRYASEHPEDDFVKSYLETGDFKILDNLRGKPEYHLLYGAASLDRVMDCCNPDASRKTLDDAVEHLKRAASADGDAAYLLAKLYLDGRYLSCNPRMGMNFLDRAVQGGKNPAALLRKAKHLMNTDRNRALALLKNASAYPEPAFLAAELMRAKGDGKNAFRYYQRAAKQGYSDAWLQMGNFFYSGSGGIRRNKQDASLCWQRFMAMDRERRQNDIQDFYWGKSRAPRMASYAESYGRTAVLLRAKPVLREFFKIVCGSRDSD